MIKTIYELVTVTPEGFLHQTRTNLESLESLIVGIETRDYLRPELQGQPKLLGYCGPMWGGEMYEIDGTLKPSWNVSEMHRAYHEKINVIRYETQQAYNMLCQ